jgi:hypothetical protein
MVAVVAPFRLILSERHGLGRERGIRVYAINIIQEDIPSAEILKFVISEMDLTTVRPSTIMLEVERAASIIEVSGRTLYDLGTTNRLFNEHVKTCTNQSAKISTYGHMRNSPFGPSMTLTAFARMGLGCSVCRLLVYLIIILPLLFLYRHRRLHHHHPLQLIQKNSANIPRIVVIRPPIPTKPPLKSSHSPSRIVVYLSTD